MKTTLGKREEKLKKHNLTNQPLPVFFKETKRDRNGMETVKYNCYVMFDRCEYELESPLKAVDIAFKTYHALQAYYPPESDAMWLFLQKAVYKFTEKWDHFNATTEILLNEFKNFKV